MKRNIKTSLSFIAILATFLFSSCKKDLVYGDITPNTDRVVVEFPNGSLGESVTTDYTATLITLDLTQVRFMTRSVVKGSSDVKITVNPTIVADYNTANGTSYDELPASLYTFVASTLTLTPTDRTAEISIKLKPSDIASGSYAIGLSIAEVTNGEISPTLKNIFVSIAVKNKYDGLYTVTGSMVDAAGSYTGIYPNSNVGLRTANANSVDYLDPNFSVGAPFFDNAYIIQNISTGGAAWLFSPRFVFNTTTDKATDVLDTDGLVLGGVISSTGPNQFTITSPDDKKFVIKYVVGGRFTINETWTYSGPR